MAKLKDGTRIYGNVTIDAKAVVTTVNASTINSSSFLMSNGVDLIALSQAGSATANLAYDAANNSNLKSGGTISGGLTISSGDLTVQSGNIYLHGNTTFINVTTYSIGDSLIYLASNNDISDTVDIGFVGAKNTSGTYSHTGLIRHAADKNWYLFDNYTTEPDNNIIDVANSTYALLKANVDGQSVKLLGNTVATQANLTIAHNQANAAYGQANAAYTKANTADTDALNAYAAANNSANTVWVYSNGTSVLSKSNLNFNNTATVNVAITANGSTQSNIEFNANSTAIGSGITLKGSRDFIVANTNTNGANTVDLSTSNYFRHILANGTVTFTFANAPTTGTGQMFSLLLIQDNSGSRTPAWTNTIYWAGGTAPPATTSANARDLWTFITYDGGSTYWGTLTMKDVR